jgi:glycosyltransferase involved in cell wall biosynthesis
MQGSLTGEMVDHGFLARDSRWYPLVRRLEYRITHLADHIITSTQQAATMVQQEFKRHHSVEPMPDCVNLDFFRPDVLSPQRRAMLRLRLGIPAKPPLVVYLGLLADYQGTHLLLKAARRIKAAGIPCHFLIMGFPSVGHYARMAANLDIVDCVTFTGMVPYERAPEYLSLGDVAVAPKLSLTEGAGKILNYMAMALPTVAYDSAINREYLGPLGTYAGPPGEVKGLADAIALLVTAQDRRADLGARLRERAGRLFCWERAAERLVNIYRHAKEGQRPCGVKSNGSR